MDGALDISESESETSQQSANQTSSVCLLQTDTSRPQYFGNNQPIHNIRLNDFDHMAQNCEINFRETLIGAAPYADLVCQSPTGDLASMAQYRQEPCNNFRANVTNNGTIPNTSRQEDITSTPLPPTNLNLMATGNWHSCANIRHFTRRRRFLSYIFGGLLTLTVNAVLAGSLSANSLTLPECPNGTMAFAASCIDKYYDKCPEHMINIHFFE